MTNELVTYQLDWLSAVDREGRQDVLTLPSNQKLWLPRHGSNGYDVGWTEESTSIQRFTSTSRPDMGTFYNISAQALERLKVVFNVGHRHFAAVEAGLDYCTATRIDLAVDIFDGGIAAHQFAENLENGLVATSARRKVVTKGVGKHGGVTSYLGSGQSPRMIRVYDKMTESKGLIPSTRVELQARGKYAAALWLKLSTYVSNLVFNTACTDAIRGLITFSGVELIDKMLENSLAHELPEDVPGDWTKWQWLIRQVLPTFVEDFAMTGEHELFKRFARALQQRTTGSESDPTSTPLPDER